MTSTVDSSEADGRKDYKKMLDLPEDRDWEDIDTTRISDDAEHEVLSMMSRYAGLKTVVEVGLVNSTDPVPDHPCVTAYELDDSRYIIKAEDPGFIEYGVGTQENINEWVENWLGGIVEDVARDPLLPNQELRVTDTQGIVDMEVISDLRNKLD